MNKQQIKDDPDSWGNIAENFRYFIEVITEVYNFKKHPILTPIMYLLTIILINSMILSIQLFVSYFN